MWRYLPKLIFFGLVVRPLVFLVLGLVVHQRARLPRNGPCLIAANHNSHLDTLVLLSLFPLHILPRVRPVAAADYFLSSRLMAWFSLHVIGILPIERTGHTDRERLFDGCRAALARGEILIVYPEGTRGEPEKMAPLKKGIFFLANGESPCPVVPVYMHGLGKALPKGEALLVPFTVEVAVDEALYLPNDKETAIATLTARLQQLAETCHAHQNMDEH